MCCQDCGAQAPTLHATSYQTIGMPEMRRPKSSKREIRRSCALRHFAQMIGLMLLTGRWGFFSIWIKCFFTLKCLVRIFFVLAMPGQDALTTH